MFDMVKIESVAMTDRSAVDMSESECTLEDSEQYEPLQFTYCSPLSPVDFGNVGLFDKEIGIKTGKNYKFSAKPADLGEVIDFSASVGYEYEIEFNFYKKHKEVEISLSMTSTISFDVTISAEKEVPLKKIKDKDGGIPPIPLAKIIVPIFAGCNVEWEPALVVSIEGSLSISNKIEKNIIGFVYNTETGFQKISDPGVKSKPSIDLSAVSIYLKLIYLIQ